MLKAIVLCAEQAIHIVLVLCGAALPIHLLVVVEEVRVDLVEEPLLLSDGLLRRHEERARDPVDEGTGGPLMRERQMEELKHLEEAAEPIDVPVLVLFRDASLFTKSQRVKSQKVYQCHHLRLG